MANATTFNFKKTIKKKNKNRTREERKSSLE